MPPLESALNCGPVPDGSAVVSVEVKNPSNDDVHLVAAHLVGKSDLDAEITAVLAADGETMIGFTQKPPTSATSRAIWDRRQPVKGFTVPASTTGFLLVAATTKDKGGFDAVDLTYRIGDHTYHQRLNNQLRLFRTSDQHVCDSVTARPGS